MEVASVQPEKRRRLKYGLNATLFTLAVVACLILLYGIVERTHYRMDFSQAKEFTLSDQTIEVLENLPKDVHILAFFRRGEELDDVYTRRKVDDILQEYKARSPKVDYQMLDPDAAPTTAVQYQVNTDGTIIFQSGNNHKEIYKSQLFDYSEMTDKALPTFVGEGLFTNALLKVTHDKQSRACLTEGHGERKSNDTSSRGFSEIKSYLMKNNYEAQSLPNLDRATLEACDVLIVAGPQSHFQNAEDELIQKWLSEKRGKLLLMTEPLTPTPLPSTLKYLKVELEPDLVLDPKRHFLVGAHYPSPILAQHEITHNLQSLNPILATVQSLNFPKEEKDIVPLMTTSEEAWGETDLSNKEKEPTFEAGKDFKGPLTLAVAVNSSAVVVGDADFPSNALIQAPGNLDLFLNMVGWLTDDKGQIAIRPKTPEFRTISMTSFRAHLIAYFSQLIYPLTVLLLGGLYWFRRRNT